MASFEDTELKRKGFHPVEKKVPFPVVLSFLAAGPVEKTAEDVDFTEVLKPCIRPGHEDAAAALLIDLTVARRAALSALERRATEDVAPASEAVDAVRAYLSILKGFRAQALAPTAAVPTAVPAEGAESGGGEAPAADTTLSAPLDLHTPARGSLRSMVRFVWRDLLSPRGDSFAVCDTMLEEASVLTALAQRLLAKAQYKHGASRDDEKALEAHKLLRMAAGVMMEAIAVCTASARATADLSTDLQTPAGLLDAWVAVALAQAQTLTLRRALVQRADGNTAIKPTLIMGLARDSELRYAELGELCRRLTSHQDGAISQYFAAHRGFKEAYFRCLRYYYEGIEHLLQESEEHAGLAVKALRESKEELGKAEQAASAYTRAARGIMLWIDPFSTTEIGNAREAIRVALEEAERVNAHVYFQPVPDHLDPIARKSLVAPIAWEAVPESTLWTPDARAAFDPSKATQQKPGVVPTNEACCVVS